jgi:hypothetical protein
VLFVCPLACRGFPVVDELANLREVEGPAPAEFCGARYFTAGGHGLDCSLREADNRHRAFNGGALRRVGLASAFPQ